jgi:hypothetical protein
MHQMIRISIANAEDMKLKGDGEREVKVLLCGAFCTPCKQLMLVSF